MNSERAMQAALPSVGQGFCEATVVRGRKSIDRVLLVSNVTLILILTIPLVAMTFYWLRNLHSDQIGIETQRVRDEATSALKERVDEAISYAEFMHRQLEDRAQQRIKSRVEEAHALVSALHARYAGKLPPAEVKQLVRDALRTIRFDEGRGYFFAADYSGVQQVRADHPELEGKSLLESINAPGRQVVIDMIDIARHQKAGFHEYRWSKPGSAGSEHPKLAYVMAFEPFGWYIGTGLYLDDVDAEIQREVLDRFDAIRWSKDGYLFVFHTDGTYIQHVQKRYVGQNLLHIEDPKGVRINERLREIALAGGGFVDYVWDKYSKGQLVPKVSYARALTDWNWVIGAGAYLDDIEHRQESAAAEIRDKLAVTLLLFLLPVTLSVLVALRYARCFRDNLDRQIQPLLEFLAARPGNRPPLEPDEDSFSELQTIAGAVRELDSNWRHSQQEFHKLSQVVEQNLSSIVIADNAPRIEYVNEAFVRNTGYSRDEVIGQNPRILASGKMPPETYAGLWQALTEKRPWKGEFYNRRKDGSEFIEFAVISPISDSNGVVTHYAAVKDDITEKKRMGEELDRHRHNLEELVEQRTVELMEARRKADAASRAKSAFLANMSHEIRTPMNGVLGVATLMRRGGVSPQQATYLDKIEASGRHLLHIINDILDLSKIEAGKLQLDPHDFELSKLVRDVEAIVRDRIEQKGLRFHIDLDSTPQHLLGDSSRLAQALLNYLNNAAKFTEQGEIALRCRCLEESETDCRLRFEVRDTGIGIAPENRQRLFNAFEQEDNTTSRRFGGTGLGLAITSRLVELMGGEVGVDSTPGLGSTFWLTVRLGRGQGGNAQSAEAVAYDAESLLRRDHSGKRVLLVEDEPINADVALILLGDTGLVVDHAADGRQAVEFAKATDYALILMDMQLPEMNGIEATRAIRALPGRERIPIIALTANAFSDNRDICLAAGMNDFFTKPYVPETLFNKLLQWLRAS